MFRVIAIGPLDDEWEKRDRVILYVAGRRADFGGAGQGEREHGFNVRDFDEAVRLRKELSKIEGLKVSLREF